MVMYVPLVPILGGEQPKCGWCGRRLRPARISETSANGEPD